MSRRDDDRGGRGGGPPPDITKMVSLKVDGLSHRTSIDDLESLFEKYGRIGDVYIPKDYRTKESTIQLLRRKNLILISISPNNLLKEKK